MHRAARSTFGKLHAIAVNALSVFVMQNWISFFYHAKRRVLLIIWKSWNNFFAFFYLFENQKYGTRVPYRYLFAKSFIKLLLKYLLLVFFKWSFLLVKKGKRIVKKIMQLWIYKGISNIKGKTRKEIVLQLRKMINKSAKATPLQLFIYFCCSISPSLSISAVVQQQKKINLLSFSNFLLNKNEKWEINCLQYL